MRTYGTQLSAKELSRFLDFSFKQNERATDRGQRGAPICVWGTHGIGKTESVITFANARGYTVVYCAPAQFEEMGDLHGIPEVFDPTPELPNSGNELTIYRPPQWLKEAIQNVDEDKPGVLILDDFNRADERILQGCMQLLQMYALFSWRLPPRWQLLLTANPEGSVYKVAEMDDAMLTRMIHVTMRFDAACWAEWAAAEGLDHRGIEFVLTYPDVVDGQRTTARSMTQFLRQIGGLDDYTAEESLWYIRVIGEGTIAPKAVDRFIEFVTREQGEIIQPLEILEARSFAKVEGRLKAILNDGGIRRNDLLSTICTRLILYILSDGYTFKTKHRTNLVKFLISEVMESSLRFRVHGAIANAPANIKESRAKLIKDPKLAKAILESL